MRTAFADADVVAGCLRAAFTQCRRACRGNANARPIRERFHDSLAWPSRQAAAALRSARRGRRQPGRMVRGIAEPRRYARAICPLGYCATAFERDARALRKR